MSTLIAPLLITFALSGMAFFAHRAMKQMHRRLLESELGGRSYNELSVHQQHFINEVVNHKFQQSLGGRLATFVLLYAYPTIYIGERIFGRTHWSAIEVFGISSLFYFVALALVDMVSRAVTMG